MPSFSNIYVSFYRRLRSEFYSHLTFVRRGKEVVSRAHDTLVSDRRARERVVGIRSSWNRPGAGFYCKTSSISTNPPCSHPLGGEGSKFRPMTRVSKGRWKSNRRFFGLENSMNGWPVFSRVGELRSRTRLIIRVRAAEVDLSTLERHRKGITQCHEGSLALLARFSLLCLSRRRSLYKTGSLP